MGHQREGLEDSEVSQASPAPEGRTPLLVPSGLGILCFLAGKMRMAGGGWF